MKKRGYIFLTIASFLMLSCGSVTKRTTRKSSTTTVAQHTKKLPSVKQIEHVRKLEKNNKGLNKYTLSYVRKYAPLAVLEMHDYKIPASITLAQGILESGNGRSELASKSNNHFGIKCHKGWNGGRVYHDDDEKGECFRKYRYVETSYKDHSTFLSSRKRYESLFSLKKTDYKAWAKGLKRAGYATDRSYPKKLIKIIEDYRLYEFDKITKKDLKKYVYKKEPEVVVKDKTLPKNSSSIKYVVKKNDTLYSISKRFNTTVEALKKLNKLRDNTLSIGLELIVK